MTKEKERGKKERKKEERKKERKKARKKEEERKIKINNNPKYNQNKSKKIQNPNKN